MKNFYSLLLVLGALVSLQALVPVLADAPVAAMEESEGGEEVMDDSNDEDSEEVGDEYDGDYEDMDEGPEEMDREMPMDHQDSLGMPSDQIAERMSEVFTKIDLNGNQMLDRSELEAWAKTVDSLAKDVHGEQEFNTLDTDRDGYINLAEMMTLYNQWDSENGENEKKFGERRFHAIDLDKNNKLDLAEIRQLLDPGQNEDLVAVESNAIMEVQDKNNDGEIDLGEYADSPIDKIAPDELAMLKKDFDSFDQNNNGTIDLEEVKKVIRDMTTNEIKRAIDELMEQQKQYNTKIAATGKGKGEGQEQEDGQATLPGHVTRDCWRENEGKNAISILTADGDIIRIPEKYPSLSLSYKNYAGGQQKGQGQPGGAFPGMDEPFGADETEKLAELMTEFQAQQGDSNEKPAGGEAPTDKDEL